MGVCIKEFVIVNNSGNIFTGDNLRDTSFAASKTFTGSTGPTCMDVVVVIGNTNEICLRPGDTVTTTITRGTGLTGSSPSGSPSSNLSSNSSNNPSSNPRSNLSNNPSSNLSSNPSNNPSSNPSSNLSNNSNNNLIINPSSNPGSSCESALPVDTKTDNTELWSRILVKE